MSSDAYEPTSQHLKVVRDQLLSDFAITPDSLRNLRVLITRLEKEGIDVVVLDMPVTARFAGFTHQDPAGPTYENSIQRIAGSTGSHVVDLSADFSRKRRYFSDTIHLNSSGRRELSSRFAHWLRNLRKSLL